MLGLGTFCPPRKRRCGEGAAPEAPAPHPRAAPAAPLAFASCESHRVRSAEGLQYKVMVSLPLSYYEDGAAEYPTLYVLDAEPYLFPLVTVAARTNHFFTRSRWHPDFLVVGVVADLEERFTRGSHDRLDVWGLWDALRPTRARDYLPTVAESPWGAPGAEPLLPVSGHASTFVRFLRITLVPFVDAQYRTARSHRALMGKSFGGSGVAAVLLNPACAQLFAFFLLGSPSLAWDDGAFFRLEEESHLSRPPLSASLYVCMGSEESADMQRLCRAFPRVLEGRGYPDLKVTLDVLQGESHGSASYPFAGRGVQWLAAQLAEAKAAEG